MANFWEWLIAVLLAFAVAISALFGGGDVNGGSEDGIDDAPYPATWETPDPPCYWCLEPTPGVNDFGVEKWTPAPP